MNHERYIKQTRLDGFGPSAQKKLHDAKVLVVGAGGLGIPVLQYLNAMGVGTLAIVEQDVVDITNLHRQVVYYETDVGQPKIEVLSDKLKEQNPNTHLILYDTFLIRDNALEIIKPYDLVIDATDNFASRYLINDACVILGKPMIYGALYGFEGQVCVFNYNGGATYRCLFPYMPAASEIPDCNEQGVLGVIPGIIGNLQAMEAVKILTGIGKVLAGKLMIYNGLDNSIYKINVPVNPINLNISELQDQYEQPYCDPSLEISPEHLMGILESEKSIQLIDVRSEEEFEDFHLSGSLNIPLDKLDVRKVEISREIPVYLICQSGIRSLQALEILNEQGFDNDLYHLKGGVDHYKIHIS